MTDELFGPSGVAEIREDILTDIANEAAKVGIEENIGVGSDNYVTVTGVAGGLMFCHARIDGGKDACTPNTARGQDLIRWQESYRLPEVDPSFAAGKVTVTVLGGGNAIISSGQPLMINGIRRVVMNGPWDVVNGEDVDVITTVAGSKGNAKAGTAVTFLNPPANVSEEAKVSKYGPIGNGFDEEDEPRRRTRVLNRSGTNPGGGNWGQIREIAFNASLGVQMCFVYPSLGGPSTDKVVLLKTFDRELFNFSREFPEAATTGVRGEIHAQISTGFTGIVESGADEETDVSLKIKIPLSTLVGGAGKGWADATIWPTLEGSETRVQISAVSTTSSITFDADTTVEPVDNLTRVAWWSPNDMQFHVRTVVSHSGSSGAWACVFDSPFVDDTKAGPSVGDFVSPAADNIATYAKVWVDLMEALGTGENTTDAQLLQHGRSLRHPGPEEENGIGISLNLGQLTELKKKCPEITDAEYAYRSKISPTVPATVADPPNVLVPRHFGVYPLL